MNTGFIPAQTIFSNGQITGNSWSNTSKIFLVDNEFATSNINGGSTSDFIIGNFNSNIPVGSVITGFEIQVIGKRGAQTSPVITLDLSFYDNVNGADNFYPYVTPFTGLTESVTTTILGTPTYLFSTTFTVDQANNFKLALIANGDISLDSVLINFYFTPPATESISYNSLLGTFQVGETVTDTITGATAEIVTDNGSDSMTVTNVVGYFQNGDSIEGGTSGATALLDAPIPGVCIDCSSPIQVQAMYLELPFLISDTKFYLKKGSFSYPNGVPVQPGDIGSCGGTIPFVFDESKRKIDGGNFEENAMLDTNNGGTWTVLSSGVIEVDLGSVNQRGLDYKTPAGHVASNMSDHDANSKVIISNNEPYNLTLVRRCQEGTLFSAPITAQDEGINLTTYLKKVNFVGAGVTSTLTSPNEIEVNIPGGSVAGQAAIQFEDEGTNLGTPGTATEIDFTGAGVTASRATNKITVNIPGGGGSGIASINGDSTAAQLLTNTDTLIDITQPVAGTNEFAINTINLGNDTNLINTITNNATFQLNVNNFVTGGSGGNPITVQDDFIGGGDIDPVPGSSIDDSTGAGELGWTLDRSNTDGTGSVITGELNHPGIYQITTIGNQNTVLYLNSFNFMQDGANYKFIVRPDTTSARNNASLGLAPSHSTAVTDFITVLFNFLTSTYEFSTRDSSTTETTSLGSFTPGDWFEIKFNITATSVQCFVGVNGATPTLVSTHSTNIPAIGTIGEPFIRQSSGSLGSTTMDIDYFSMYDPTANAKVNQGGNGGFITTEVNVSSADILGMFVTPVEILPAPGTGKTIVINNIVSQFIYGTTQYAGGSNVAVGDENGNGNSTTVLSTGEMRGSSDVYTYGQPGNSSANTFIPNQKVLMTTTGSSYTTGDSTIKLTITYQIITL